MINCTLIFVYLFFTKLQTVEWTAGFYFIVYGCGDQHRLSEAKTNTAFRDKRVRLLTLIRRKGERRKRERERER